MNKTQYQQTAQTLNKLGMKTRNNAVRLLYKSVVNCFRFHDIKKHNL